MNRKLVDPAVADISNWPEISTEGMEDPELSIVENRRRCMRMYCGGRRHKDISASTGIDRRRVSELFTRCTQTASDGKLVGFRGCLYYERIKAYVRTAPSVGTRNFTRYGHSGEFCRLIDRFPHIGEELVKSALAAGRGANESISNLGALHKDFLELCEKAGIRRDQYPFTVETQGEQALRRWLVRALVTRELREVVRASLGNLAADRLGSAHAPVRIGDKRTPLVEVQFDGHRIDAHFVIAIPDPFGGEPIVVVLQRIWILTVIDVRSRAVLGYHVSLEREYTAQDVLTCVENAMVPWKPRDLVVPGMSYTQNAGMPSSQIPDLAYAKWAQFSFDNSKANIATWVWKRISEKIGCVLNPGPVKTPERRIFIERFFKCIEQGSFQRLPSTTGSHPKDPKRRDSESAAVELHINLDEILDLVDLVVSTYNCTRTVALHNRSPLEYLQFAIQNDSLLVDVVPEDERAEFAMTILRKEVRVRGRLKAGERPFVEFEGVKYYSPKLGESGYMIGRQMFVEAQTRDLRYVKLVFPSGEVFGELQAEQKWAGTAHDLRTRRAILRCHRECRYSRRESKDHVRDYLKRKRALAVQSKAARNEVAKIEMNIRKAAAKPPRGPDVPVVPPEPVRKRGIPANLKYQRSRNF